MSNERFIYTLSVSYPRCGFGITSRILKRYFKRNSTVNNFILCYPANARNNRAQKCCFSDKVPHKSDGVVLQKSHDFLTKPINIIKDINTQYLLFYRNPLSSISSYYIIYKKILNKRLSEKPSIFNYFLERTINKIFPFGKKSKLTMSKWGEFKKPNFDKFMDDLIIKENIVSFDEFAKKSIVNWNKFMNKWYLDTSINILKIEYNDLIENPFKNISKIIKYLAPDHKIDESILKNIILKAKIGYVNEIKDYEFYNKDDFEKYESMTIWGKIKK